MVPRKSRPVPTLTLKYLKATDLLTVEEMPVHLASDSLE